MGHIRKHPRALRDLEGISALLKGWAGPLVADRFLEAVEKLCRLLADMPLLGAKWEYPREGFPEVRSFTLRRFRKYYILYQPIPDGIELLRVLHGSQKTDEVFRDL